MRLAQEIAADVGINVVGRGMRPMQRVRTARFPRIRCRQPIAASRDTIGAAKGPPMKPDLTLLYSELGLQPNCSLAELQLAYRRRISELQPNRMGGMQSPESVAVLRDLIGLYTTATRFHRRYGRLPGAAPHRGGRMAASLPPLPSPSSPSPSSPPPSPPRMRQSYRAPAPETGDTATPRIAFWAAVILLILLFVLVALASGEWLR